MAYNYLMMIEKEFQMKKVLASLLIASTIATPAMAWGEREQGILTGVAGLWVVQQLHRAGQQQPQVVYQQPQVVYVPVVQAPRQYCELKSEMINGQVVTGNFCYYR